MIPCHLIEFLIKFVRNKTITVLKNIIVTTIYSVRLESAILFNFLFRTLVENNKAMWSLQDAPNSAVLGATYRAKHGLSCSTGSNFKETIQCIPPLSIASRPYADSDQVK